MPNRLAQETSPYLLQHANNPVDWFPWSDEALELAKNNDKPIFLSIGYSACHWCHVMEHESFESEAIAATLNRDFVCIKVDREERPDLDNIYMTAVQLLTGRGGWPMSVFLTPELQPFFGGTYWPPTSRNGMPGFDRVLEAVMDAWNIRREQAIEQAGKLTERIVQVTTATKEDEFSLAYANQLIECAAQFEKNFDETNGGFGTAPKFPTAMGLDYLLRVWHRTRRPELLNMVTLTLDRMAAGGIYDHLAGGFARYSTDEKWLVPHFEKMLYDNALLTRIFLDAYAATADENYARVARETIEYILTYMTDEQGAFHSTEDADSEGEEGKFYVWSVEEIHEVLGPDLGSRFCEVYDVTQTGNFEGTNILNLRRSLAESAAAMGHDEAKLREEMNDARERLLAYRDKRVRPGKDDKILVSWNGLMIDAMARGGCILREPRFVEAAARAATFILEQMTDEQGRLLHCFRNGQSRFTGYLDDYGCLLNALITLYETTFDESWIDQSMKLADMIRQFFGDDNAYGFFYTASDHEKLIARQKDVHDSSVPSGNGMVANAFTRLGKLCGRADLLSDARGILDMASELMSKSPTAAGQLLIALDMQTGPFPEVVLVGERDEKATQDSLDAFWKRYIPNRVIALREEAERDDGSHFLDAIFLGRKPLYGTPAVYVCEKFACQSPVSGKEATIAKWSELVAMGEGLP
ncbi:MAG: thioredoxin domain-containing protein [Planctomycetota bacterium]